MFKKVLIVEDHESVNISVQKTLTDLGIAQDYKNYVFYCDDAIMRIKKAIGEQKPYELLITDLSFEDDTTQQKITTGIDLIKAAKALQPNLKVLIFSIENRESIAQQLAEDLGIDAFVPKARHDAKDLKIAVETIFKNKQYLSPNLKQAAKIEAPFEFTAFDKTIISLLSNGIAQKEIPFHLHKKEVKPAGLSSVEKRLNFIKTALNISNNSQLIAYCKDKAII